MEFPKGTTSLSRTKGQEEISCYIRKEISPHCVRRNDRSTSKFTVAERNKNSVELRAVLCETLWLNEKEQTTEDTALIFTA